MWKSNFHNQGQSLIGIIIVLVIVGLISGGLYYYLSKQIPEVPEITEKPVEEVVPEKKVKREEEVEDIVLKEITHNLVVDFLDWFKSSTVALPFQLKNYSIENVYIDEIREDCFGTTVEYSVETPVKSDYWKTGSWAYNKKLFADIIKDDEKYKIRELGTSRSATSYWGISGWKTYRNDEYGFEVQYPEDAEIVESQFPGTIRIDLPYILGTTLSEKYLIISTKGSIPEECSNPMSIMIRETETVYFNDIEFKKESGDEIAAGNVYESVSYSKMRENKCISLSFVLRSANRGVFYGFDVPPDFDQEKESEIFEKIMSTLRFEELIAQKCTDGTPTMQCSITKPLYCQHLKLVPACQTCGCPDGMMCQQDNTCTRVDLGEKVYILENGSPSQKVELLFIPHNVSNFATLESKINDILYKTGTNINGERMVSLFNTEPFKSYKHKFNVAYVNKNINESLFGCWKPEPDPTRPPEKLFFLCDNDKIKEEYKIFEPDYIIVIFNEPEYISSGGEIQYLNINLESSSRFATLSWTFVHEFGHQFGGLADEYVTTDSPARHCGTAVSYTCFENYKKALEYYPNLDTLGCPKWCQSYDLNKDEILMRENNECREIKNQENCRATFALSCTWFNLKHPFFNTHCVSTQGAKNIGINCEGDSMCVFGGDYGQLAFNPGGSIMGGGREFNWPSKKHLESILNCCYPRKETSFCQNFRNQFKNIPSSASVHPDLKKAYDKIVNCP